VTAPVVASPQGWQVSVLGWPVGGDAMVGGGVMAVAMGVVAVDGKGVVDGDGVGGSAGC
jgi:hypothetical protein